MEKITRNILRLLIGPTLSVNVFQVQSLSSNTEGPGEEERPEWDRPIEVGHSGNQSNKGKTGNTKEYYQDKIKRTELPE